MEVAIFPCSYNLTNGYITRYRLSRAHTKASSEAACSGFHWAKQTVRHPTARCRGSRIHAEPPRHRHIYSPDATLPRANSSLLHRFSVSESPPYPIEKPMAVVPNSPSSQGFQMPMIQAHPFTVLDTVAAPRYRRNHLFERPPSHHRVQVNTSPSIARLVVHPIWYSAIMLSYLH